MNAPERDGRPAAWICARCGKGPAETCLRLDSGCQIDAALIVARLEAAGATLLALRGHSPRPAGLGCAWPTVVHDWQGYGWTDEQPRPAIPDAVAISRMDTTYLWLQRISSEKRVLRRIVAARSLVHPLHGRHVYTWRRLGRVLGCDYHAVIRWHGQGIAIIVASHVQSAS